MPSATRATITPMVILIRDTSLPSIRPPFMTDPRFQSEAKRQGRRHSFFSKARTHRAQRFGLLFLFEKWEESFVAFLFQLFDRNESKRSRIDAVTHPAFVGWTIIEDMAKMRIAFATPDLRPFHQESAIR